MKRFRPIHAILLIGFFSSLILLANFAYQGGFSRSDYERVAPGADGLVRIDTAGLLAEQVRFFHFVNAGNQEVKFFVGRDGGQDLQVAFDANDLCYKLKRGYRSAGEWIVCNKCERSFKLDQVNQGGGGCNAVPLEFRTDGTQLVLTEDDILRGWRYFR